MDLDYTTSQIDTATFGVGGYTTPCKTVHTINATDRVAKSGASSVSPRGGCQFSLRERGELLAREGQVGGRVGHANTQTTHKATQHNMTATCLKHVIINNCNICLQLYGEYVISKKVHSLSL